MPLRYDDMRPLIIQNVSLFDSEPLIAWLNTDVGIESGKFSSLAVTSQTIPAEKVQLIAAEGASRSIE